MSSACGIVFAQEIFVRAAPSCDEVVFDGLDASFGCIATMILRWDELVGDLVVVEVFQEFLGIFVV